jgi:hypothetical protein
VLESLKCILPTRVCCVVLCVCSSVWLFGSHFFLAGVESLRVSPKCTSHIIGAHQLWVTSSSEHPSISSFLLLPSSSFLFLPPLTLLCLCVCMCVCVCVCVYVYWSVHELDSGYSLVMLFIVEFREDISNSSS